MHTLLAYLRHNRATFHIVLWADEEESYKAFLHYARLSGLFAEWPLVLEAPVENPEVVIHQALDAQLQGTQNVILVADAPLIPKWDVFRIATVPLTVKQAYARDLLSQTAGRLLDLREFDQTVARLSVADVACLVRDIATLDDSVQASKVISETLKWSRQRKAKMLKFEIDEGPVECYGREDVVAEVKNMLAAKSMAAVVLTGYGNTLAANYIASQLGLPRIQVHPSSIYSKYVGEAEKNLHELGQTLVKLGSACIIFDNADAWLTQNAMRKPMIDLRDYLSEHLRENIDARGLLLFTSREGAAAAAPSCFQAKLLVLGSRANLWAACAPHLLAAAVPLHLRSRLAPRLIGRVTVERDLDELRGIIHSVILRRAVQAQLEDEDALVSQILEALAQHTRVQ